MTPTLLCPLCHYNLTGLPTPRCPECGHTFDWADFTDPARQSLPWLVEHRRGLRGFPSTGLRVLLPWRFWTTLRPTHRVSVRRLLLFLASSTFALIIIPPALLFGSMTATLIRMPPGFWGPEPIWQTVLYYLRQHFGHGRPLVMLVALSTVLLALPLALILLFAIMRQSSRRARIRWPHFLRVAAYSLDPSPLALVFILATASIILLAPGSSPNSYFLTPAYNLSDALPTAILITIAFHALSLLRLHFALSRYLPFPRPWLITLAAAVLALALIPAFSALVWPLILR